MFSQIIFCQTSIIKGITIDENTGKSLPGVIVEVKDSKLSTISDSDGNFALRDVPVGKYEIRFSASSFQTKVISEVEVTIDEVTNLTVSMMDNKNVINEIVVISTKKAESLKSLLTMQKNSTRVSDGISAETIKRTPDKNTSDVLKRISGASVQDNKFVIIRGLNDRYNASFLNGAPLPSSEPDRKAFSFDIFPANMIDNLTISKTATPDLPGDFAGGVIQINTKGTPDKNFQTISFGGGYNTITTGKKQVYYKGGNTDWLGLDDGTRALPSEIPDYFTFQGLSALERAEYAKSLNGDWSLHQKNFAPNFNFQYTSGLRLPIGDKVLGALFSVSHNKANNFNQTQRRSYEIQGEELPSTLYGDLSDNNYSEQFLTSGLANFSFKLNGNNTFSFKNMYSINSDDRVIERSGIPQEATQPGAIKLRSTARWFTSNQIYSGQLNGEHYFTKSKFRINWLTSYSNVSRSIPNLRRNSYSGFDQDPDNADTNDYVYIANIADNNGGADYGGGMFFSENNEKIYNSKVDFTNKLSSTSTDELKYGLFVQNRKRDFFARQLQYNQLNSGSIVFDSSLLELDESSIFNIENIGEIEPNVGGFTLFDATKYFDAYTASSSLQAGYAMMDNKFNKLRIIWGVRLENYRQKLNTRLTETEDLNVDNKQLDFLPSANLIYAVNKKQNIRLSYSKTINRPEFRELAPFGFYDFTTQFFTSGNPDLKIADIQNGDFRYEIYPGKSQLFSVSAFYKKFKNPIELIAGVNNNEVIYKNAESTTNYGFEMEFRTLLASLFNTEKYTLLNNLTVFSNVSIIKSKVDVSNIAASSDTEKSRPMQGQSPYVFNAGLQYLTNESGWSFSTNINRVGSRIAVVGNTEGEPTLWEKSRTFLDGQISKTFAKKKFEIKFNIQNLLAQDLIFYQNRDLDDTRISGFKGLVNSVFTGDSQNKNGYNSKEDDVVWKTGYGRTFSFTLTYNF